MLFPYPPEFDPITAHRGGIPVADQDLVQGAGAHRPSIQTKRDPVKSHDGRLSFQQPAQHFLEGAGTGRAETPDAVRRVRVDAKNWLFFHAPRRFQKSPVSPHPAPQGTRVGGYSFVSL